MRISDWSSDVCSSDLQIEEGSRVIGDAIDEQALATTNIATSTDQGAAGAEEMSRVVEGLREQTGEAEQAAAQVTSMAGELADQSAMMRMKMRDFFETEGRLIGRLMKPLCAHSFARFGGECRWRQTVPRQAIM